MMGPRSEDRAIMLGIRHRCGMEVQFWIPGHLVPAIADSLGDDLAALELRKWMVDDGLIPEAEVDENPEPLVKRLGDGLHDRGAGFVNVESDPSVCPGCGSLLPWINILADYARGKHRE